MAMTEDPGPSPTPESRSGPALIALIADDRLEPTSARPDIESASNWAAVTAFWHPSILARVSALPTIEDLESPTAPGPGEIRVVAAGLADRLPTSYRIHAEEIGATLIEGKAEAEPDRLALVDLVLRRIEPGASPDPIDPEGDGLASDFLALGAARWWLRDLHVAMDYTEHLDEEALAREVLAGAIAWREGDWPATAGRLRAAFELLSQAREQFYPVDVHLLDLCLLDPATPAETLDATLAARSPVTFMAPARALESLSGRRPEHLEAIRQGVTEGWIDIAGGPYEEVDEPLRPIESIFWQYRKGGELYRREIDERNVETLARRRFGLYPMLPQVARRFGLRYALHMGFDAGTFPIQPEPKKMWEAPDGTSLEALHRPPLAADRATSGALLPWRLAQTMREDHVATLPLIHWPSPVAGWYLDLRRVGAYGPVLARWTTLGDYFNRTDRPYESAQPLLDEYQSPYLDQAVAAGDPGPISDRVEHARLRARLDGLSWLQALTAALDPSPAEVAASIVDEEEALETGRLAEEAEVLDAREPGAAEALASLVTIGASSGRPGYLVLNPLGIARRAAVLLPDAAPDLRPEGPLRAAQFTDEGVWAVVDLPAFGYAWVPRETSADAPAAPPGQVSAKGRVLANASMEVEIDAKSGGIRSIRAPGEATARLGQQVVVTGLVGTDSAQATGRMQAEGFEIEYAGPALVQAISRGVLLDPEGDRRLASFRQRYRLWAGRPTLEIDLTLDDLDPSCLDARRPWQSHVACRWAWPDPEATLRRTSLLAPEPTDSRRPETPDALDITARQRRTALLFGGLAHHRRQGNRMLDTLLVAGNEAARSFRFGVALDLEHPFHGVQDFLGPAYVVPTETGPPRTGPTGWFFRIDSKAIAATRVEFLEHSGDGRGWGLAFHLIETHGRASRCRLRSFRDPTWARQVNFHDELILDLPVDGDAVPLDLTPNEITRVDVTFG